ncbi:MAG: hypothetical protein QM734_15200 [Cyclobacteriaceae bacterium]
MKLQFRINKPYQTVFEYLIDVEKFSSVHPVINKIDHLHTNHYLVHETLRVAFIPFSFTYPVTIDYSLENKEINMKAVVMKLTTIEMNFKLSSENNLTIVDEEIIFKSPLPIRSMLEKTFQKQHKLLFENIEHKDFEPEH